MPSILVTICARGGSRGVKGKNIRPLQGKPLIVYSIEQALRWDKAARVVVSTDSGEIARIAREAGAEVPFMRPEDLATDHCPKGPVIRHALVSSEAYYQEKYDIIVDLDATAPVRTVEDLNNCLEDFLARKPKTLFSVVKAHKNPYFNMVERTPEGKVVLCKAAEKAIYGRQATPAVYALNASIYFYDRQYLLTADLPSPLSDQSVIFEMGDVSGIDIDREIDFLFVEFLLAKNLVDL